MSDLERLQRERDQYARTVSELTTRFEEKVEALSLVRRVGDALGSSLDLHTVCSRTVDLLLEAVSPEHCSVMLVEASGGLVRVAARGAFDDEAVTYEEAAEAAIFAAGEGIAGSVASNGQALRFDDAREDPRFVRLPESDVTPGRQRVVDVFRLDEQGRIIDLGVYSGNIVPGSDEEGIDR